MKSRLLDRKEEIKDFIQIFSRMISNEYMIYLLIVRIFLGVKYLLDFHGLLSKK